MPAPGAPGLGERLARDVDDVVLALPEGGALLDEEADDAERDPVDRDRPADRVEAREELVAHLRADDGDEGAALVLRLGEEAPEVDVEVRELGDVRRHARDLDVGEALAARPDGPARPRAGADHDGGLREALERLEVALLDPLPLERLEEPVPRS